MTPFEKLEHVLSDAPPIAGVMVFREGQRYRASVLRASTDPLKQGNTVSPCRDSAAAAVETLYEMVVEEAWKQLRPAESRLRGLGVDIKVATQSECPADAKEG